MLLWDKAQVFLYLNGLHTPELDLVFPIVTLLGDGWLLLFVGIALLLYKLGYFLDFALASLISTVFVQLGKRVLFADTARPLGLLGEDVIHIIEGVKVHSYRSFPSGHSTTAMFISLFIATIVRKPSLKFLAILLGMLGGYSRIYLSQHFFTDVFAGFLIAFISTYTIFVLRNRIGEPLWFNKKILPY